jgi:hypothetical protein
MGPRVRVGICNAHAFVRRREQQGGLRHVRFEHRGYELGTGMYVRMYECLKLKFSTRISLGYRCSSRILYELGTCVYLGFYSMFITLFHFT